MSTLGTSSHGGQGSTPLVTRAGVAARAMERPIPPLFRGWTLAIAAITTAAAAAVVVCYITSEDLVPPALLLAAASLAHVLNNYALRASRA